MKNSINRRSVLKSAAATIVATSVVVPVLAEESNPDAELIVLGMALDKQRKAFKDASMVCYEAYTAIVRECPERPEGFWIAECIPPVLDATLSDARRAKFEEFEAARNVADKKYRIDELDKIANAEFSKISPIEDEIQKIPAQTMAGIVIKLDVWRWHQDTEALEGCDILVEDALQDAKRLSVQQGGDHV